MASYSFPRYTIGESWYQVREVKSMEEGKDQEDLFEEKPEEEMTEEELERKLREKKLEDANKQLGV